MLVLTAPFYTLYLTRALCFYVFANSSGNGQTMTTPLANCLAIRNLGYTTDGVYYVNPTNAVGQTTPVHCDMTTDGGGWTLVVVIATTDQAHSNVNQFAITPITPTSPSTYIPSGPGTTAVWMSMKLADTLINQLMTPANVNTRASIRFVCDSVKHFFKNCNWHSTKGWCV
jgi:hypothetical protein